MAFSLPIAYSLRNERQCSSGGCVQCSNVKRGHDNVAEVDGCSRARDDERGTTEPGQCGHELRMLSFRAAISRWYKKTPPSVGRGVRCANPWAVLAPPNQKSPRRNNDEAKEEENNRVGALTGHTKFLFRTIARSIHSIYDPVKLLNLTSRHS